MMIKPAILILDDESRLIEEISEFLTAQDYEVFSADRPSAAFQAIEDRQIGLALVDIKLPEYDGLEFIRRLKQSRPEIETIVMSGHGDMESVIEAFRLGTFDYLKKPFSTLDLQAALGRTGRYLAALDASRQYANLCAELNKHLAADADFIGVSKIMDSVREQIALAAVNPGTPVLIQGESGTGKELVARQIHALGARASGRFVAVNCAAVPRSIFESEFFGHERGAFTDARTQRDGLFRSANGGTLFLDEIGETPLDMQPKFLRAIEERLVRPVGSDEDRKSDARIVCASNRDLAEQARIGSFRQDLYYRLAVIVIQLPPLRKRRDDIPVLARHFLKQSQLQPLRVNEILDGEFLDMLSQHDFPGNVRELKNFMERTAILGRRPNSKELAGWFGLSHAPAEPGFTRPDAVTHPDADIQLDTDASLNLATLEAEAIDRALIKANGVHAQAARLLGITRQSFDRRLKKIRPAS